MSDLESLFRRLRDLLDGAAVPFMVAGSFASTAHGLPRTTQGLHLVIDATPENLERLLRAMPTEHYYVDADALARRTMFNVIDQATGWKIDLIVRKNRAFSREEFARRIAMPLLGVPLFVASPEDTIVANSNGRRKAAAPRDNDATSPESSRPSAARSIATTSNGGFASSG